MPKCPTWSKILTIFWSFWGVFDPLKIFSGNFLDVISEWVEFPIIPQIFKFLRRWEHTQLLTSVRRIKKKKNRAKTEQDKCFALHPVIK